MSFSFRCATCNEIHAGMPALAADAPLYYYAIPESQRAERCELTSDTCTVDDQFHFLRANIEIPVDGLSEPFVWGVWASVSRENFGDYMEHFNSAKRVELGPFFGWLSASFKVYPDSENLKTRLHLQPPDIRPLIELQPTEHPLAVEQRMGITQKRLSEIYAAYLH